MRRFVSKLASTVRPGGKARHARRGERRASLRVEALESRQLLSITPFGNLIIPPLPPIDYIQIKYQDLGGAQGFLGKPTSGEMPTPYGGGLYETFQGGTIYYSAKTGTHVIYGAIGAEYAATANEHDANGTVVQKDLGLPTSDEKDVPGLPGARMNTFPGGAIYWSPTTNAHVIYGAIGDKYAKLGGPAGWYGLPTSDEADVPGLPGVRVTSFPNGRAIYWSQATGAWAVYGAIAGEYNTIASETDYYGTNVRTYIGAPTSDEIDTPGYDMNTFQWGAIYWSEATGAHVVYGGIGARYNSLGGATSFLGLPTGDEEGIPGGREQFFQNGKILWTALGGTQVVKAVSKMTFDTEYIDLGDVKGWGQLTVYANGSYNFTGHFVDTNFWSSYNYSFVIGIRSPSGVLYTFSHTGHVSGTAPWLSGSSHDDWDVSGTNVALATGWADLEGASGYDRADSKWDVASLIQAIETVAKVVAAVKAIV
jgi:uncharacterized protein with LGFP repeats